jgi:hypothetical protein
MTPIAPAVPIASAMIESADPQARRDNDAIAIGAAIPIRCAVRAHSATLTGLGRRGNDKGGSGRKGG